MVLQKVQATARRPFAPAIKRSAPAIEAPARAAPETIYSRLLGMNLYPSRDPFSGNIVSIRTEDGDSLTLADIEAFRLIEKTFGIETIERIPGRRK
jgi:hypothetical protein